MKWPIAANRFSRLHGSGREDGEGGTVHEAARALEVKVARGPILKGLSYNARYSRSCRANWRRTAGGTCANVVLEIR